MVRRVVICGRGDRGLVCLADRRRGGREGGLDELARDRRRHRGLRGGDRVRWVQDLVLRGQQELLHQRRDGRVRAARAWVVVVVGGGGDVGCRGGDEDAAAVASALVVNDGFAAHCRERRDGGVAD